MSNENDKPKSVAVLGLPAGPLRLAIEKAKREADLIAEAAVVMAKLRRRVYLAYIAEGFNEDQALALTRDYLK